MDILSFILPKTDEITVFYILAQVSGMIFTVLCVVSLFLKKREKLLFISGIANFFNVLAMLFLGAFSSAFISTVAVLQIFCTVWRLHRGKSEQKWEIPAFTVLFLIGGALGYKSPIDHLPILSSMIFMSSVPQKKKIPYLVLSLANCAVLTVYNLIIGSTALFGITVTAVSIIVVIIKTLANKNEEF